MVVVYGIGHCDTVQRARQRLDAAGIAYRFHDFKAEGLSPALAQAWIDALGVDAVVHRRGTTRRKLDETTRAHLDAGHAAALRSREPALVKRPVIAWPGGLVAGFAQGDEAAILEHLR